MAFQRTESEQVDSNRNSVRNDGLLAAKRDKAASIGNFHLRFNRGNADRNRLHPWRAKPFL